MIKGFLKILTALIFIFTALGIGALVLYPPPWNAKKATVELKPRLIIPLIPDAETFDSHAERLAREDNLSVWAPLPDGEVIVSVLTGYFDEVPVEKQFAAYRNLLEIDSAIYLSYIDFDEESRSYKRLWSAKTLATRPGTVSVYAQDLLGDRSVCVLLYGMNSQEEHTLTVFRKNPSAENEDKKELFTKIAELRIEGTITVRQLERGQNQRQSLTISAFGRDMESSNFLDQVEIIFAFNAAKNFYEEISRIRIPGAQVEQRRVRELLGSFAAFEDFISGLWYHVTSQGIVDKNQYIFFSPPNREIIFYGDETQQVFHWLMSTNTRYGLYVSSQNISVTTLKRSIDIELESLESIRVRVNEDVRLKIGVNAPWDGSYRKAEPPENRGQKPPLVNAHIDAWYDGSLGKIHFLSDGSYEANSGSSMKQGNYAFFSIGGEELLELRFAGAPREIYLIESEDEVSPKKNLALHRVRIGVKGIVPLSEMATALTLVSD
jgi:hypothetical protein